MNVKVKIINIVSKYIIFKELFNCKIYIIYKIYNCSKVSLKFSFWALTWWFITSNDLYPVNALFPITVIIY